ncbi:Uncharacterised protein [Vibrio cholerae]|nr:Uncharacterised protein [Vibrio cholerae]CSI90564.1 Uncharacterised protein [Vibrio cholerae]
MLRNLCSACKILILLLRVFQFINDLLYHGLRLKAC